MFCVFYFIKISKFALPGVMLIYERTSKDRKKERKKKKMTNYGSNLDRLLPICCHRELLSWICTNCVRGVLNGNGWDPFLCIQVDFYGDLSHHL